MNSIDLRPIEQAEQFLKDVNGFLDKLWQAQNQEGGGAINDLDQNKEPIYKSNKDFSVELQHYVHECEWLTSQLQLSLSIRRDYNDYLATNNNATNKIFYPENNRVSMKSLLKASHRLRSM